MFWKTVYRNTMKNKGVSLLNLVGLSLGLTCTLLLVSWAMHESDHDDYIREKESIYRVTYEGVFNGEKLESPTSLWGIGPFTKNNFPKVKDFTRIASGFANPIAITTGNTKTLRQEGYPVDQNFFDFFTIKPLYGDLATCLQSGKKIVLTQSLAKKMFGNTNPTGEIIQVKDEDYTVSAVIEDLPSNSHIRFDFVFSSQRLQKQFTKDSWGSDSYITYLKLNKDAPVEKLNAAITKQVRSVSKSWGTFNVTFRLQALKDIYFDNDYGNEISNHGNKNNLYLFASIAFFILVIACVNFVNLFISISLKRKKNIIIKMTFGARKAEIVKEFILEVLVYIILSFITALLLLELIHPYFNNLAGKEIPINIYSFEFIMLSLGLIGITLILAGTFPGVYLTRIQSFQQVKPIASNRGIMMNLQKLLVTFQFIIACGLIFSLITIMKQVHFLKTKHPGFNKENVLYIPAYGELKNFSNIHLLKQELLKNPDILDIAYRGGKLTEWNTGFPLSADKEGKMAHPHEMIEVGDDYFDLLNIEFIEGKNVFKLASTAPPPLKYCILNEKSVEKIVIPPPYVDKVVYGANKQPFVIKGVVKNVNTKALNDPINPCIYIHPVWQNEGAIILFKVQNNVPGALKAIRQYQEKHFSGHPFEYTFLDEHYDNLYKSEMNTRRIILWFSVLAIFLTSMGLLAMAYFITENRTREIGIRKVNGAKIKEILTMLNAEFSKWVTLAFIIASPIAWYTMNKWLQNFAYKTELSWWIFALAGTFALGIALLTVSWQSWRAARRNPVESLRYE